MGATMQIHLSKPGGEREGPFTLEKIKQDLAANKYRDTDYWAWHEGLTEWVPLYAVEGVSAKAGAAAPPVPPSAPEQATTPAPPQAPSRASPEPAPAASEPEPAGTRPEVASGMPVSALEHVFAFTTGEGPEVWHSPTVARMLEAIAGAEMSAVRQSISRDIVGQCAVGELLKPDGSISEAVWRAMAAHQPALVQQARERLYHVCVRTFRSEGDTVVALVLFYNKQKFAA
jgi:GYF domain 2